MDGAGASTKISTGTAMLQWTCHVVWWKVHTQAVSDSCAALPFVADVKGPLFEGSMKLQPVK